jgi:hypothetical protein
VDREIYSVERASQPGRLALGERIERLLVAAAGALDESQLVSDAIGGALAVSVCPGV